MDWLGTVDWHDMFASTVPPLELIVRGSIIYLGILTFIRFLLRREAAGINVPDLLMLVLIADASQNAMAAEYKTVTDGAVLIGTILFWNYALDFLAFYFPTFARVLHPPPLLLVRNGRMIPKNMRVESITEEELWSQLRENGVEDLGEIKAARMEGDGRISIIKRRR